MLDNEPTGGADAGVVPVTETANGSTDKTADTHTDNANIDTAGSTNQKPARRTRTSRRRSTAATSESTGQMESSPTNEPNLSAQGSESETQAESSPSRVEGETSASEQPTTSPTARTRRRRRQSEDEGTPVFEAPQVPKTPTTPVFNAPPPPVVTIPPVPTPEPEPPTPPTRRRPAPVPALFMAPEPLSPPEPSEDFEEPTPTSTSRRSRSRRAASVAPVDESSADDEVTAESDQTSSVGDTRAERGAKNRTGREELETPEELEDTSEPSDSEEGLDGVDDTDSADITVTRRRRRRGRRGRGRGRGGESVEEEVTEETAPQEAVEISEPSMGSDTSHTDPDTESHGEQLLSGVEGVEEISSVRRRRRRRRRGTAIDTEPAPDDPPNTVVRVREPRGTGMDEVQGLAGSTRLEAKRQRRRDGREQRRTRPPILSEAEFLARREAVDRVMAIRHNGERAQIAVLEDGVLVEHYVAKRSNPSLIGNVYLGKVQNVLPSMEAAFIDIGRGRNAVLYAGEVNWDLTGLEGRGRAIEQALKPGDSVLVQVTKDPVGHKGARLTSHIALSGRHLVYVPNGNTSGISRKLSDTERKRLREVLKKLVPENAGVIVRTAAEGATEEELSRDVVRLQALWESIQQKAAKGGAPALLYEEPDLVIKVVRDLFNEDFREMVIQGDEAWNMVEPYLAHVSPDLVGRLRRHTGPTDLFTELRIDEQLLKALDRKVYLPSGGHLVIDRTEAMTVVDVNTGKFTGQGGNLEETVTRNNLEAAEEIVHQLRLRDIGGIIVIDFIDMVLESNRELVLRRLTECLGRDRTKHQVTEITSLGLVQMTRKRMGQGLLEAFSETCEHCKGRGVIIHTDMLLDGSRSSRRRSSQSNEATAASVQKSTTQPQANGAQANGQATSAQTAGVAGTNGHVPTQTGEAGAEQASVTQGANGRLTVAAAQDESVLVSGVPEGIVSSGGGAAVHGDETAVSATDEEANDTTDRVGGEQDEAVAESARRVRRGGRRRAAS